MNAIIKKRLQALEKAILPYSKDVVVELPNGTIARKSAVEWWNHREEWPLADLGRQNNSGGLMACLIFAALADEAIEKAAADDDALEAERLTAEREEMLKKYFGKTLKI